ncbi:MAG: hypothetical protein LBD53_07575 [Tannerella sp.]|nr:hypothetical protein [Tannerella sp.]
MGRHLVTPHTRVVAENRLQGSKTTARVWATVPPNALYVNALVMMQLGEKHHW